MKRINLILFIILWLSVLGTFSYALANGYLLLFSDKLGFIALSIASLIIVRKPKISGEVLLCLLLPGVLNVFSFIYFFNFLVSFGFSALVSPGLQLFSIALLAILIKGNKGLLSKSIRFMLSTSQTDLEDQSTATTNVFLERFKKHSTEELKNMLYNDLSPEAKSAVMQILKSRDEDQANSLIPDSK